MGTSGSYPGPVGPNPLIPTWLEPIPQEGGEMPPPQDAEQGPERPPVPQSQAPPGNSAGFPGVKSSFSRYASSGGNRHTLGKAVAGYVSKASGGPAKAASRMGASRSAAGRLLGFLADAQARGLFEALKSLDLGALAGKSAEDIFFGLADYVCPTEGTLDAGIARDAYAETIIECIESGLESLDSLTESQVGIIFESFLANSIFDRLCADVGAGLVQLSKDPREAASVQSQIKSYLRGAVHDAIGQRLANVKTMSESDAKNMASDVYRQAFSILAAYDERQSARI